MALIAKKMLLTQLIMIFFLLEVAKTTSKGIINIPSDEEVYT